MFILPHWYIQLIFAILVIYTLKIDFSYYLLNFSINNTIYISVQI